MRASRLLTILLTLQQHRRVTAAALAERLEVSRRTIYRDVDELSAAGVPVYADRGPGGGFALLDGFRTELTGLTTAESEALMLAGVPAAAADLGLAMPASSARLKLAAALAPGTRAAAERVAGRFHLDVADWYRRPEPPEHLGTFARAVWEARRLWLRYDGWHGVSEATVEPLGLVLKAGRWYLLALKGGTERIYRIDGAREAELLEDCFERPGDFDLTNAWARSLARFEASLHRGTAKLRVHASALNRIERLGADAAEPLLAAKPDKAGRRTAEVPIEGIAHAASLLLGFADEIEVLAPLELRDELARRAARVIALYRPAGDAPA